jgi:hypothetical protein
MTDFVLVAATSIDFVPSFSSDLLNVHTNGSVLKQQRKSKDMNNKYTYGICPWAHTLVMNFEIANDTTFKTLVWNPNFNN